MEALLSTSKAVEEWMADQVAKQEKILNTDEPVLVTAKVLEKKKYLESELLKLVTKKKPKVKKEPTSTKEEKAKETTEQPGEETTTTESKEHDEL